MGDAQRRTGPGRIRGGPASSPSYRKVTPAPTRIPSDTEGSGEAESPHTPGALASPTTATVPHDPETGEVHEPKARRGGWGGRRKRELTPEEQAIADGRAADRRRIADVQEAFLERLSPALAIESDPPVRKLGKALTDISRAPELPNLLEAPRLSGRGLEGSALVVSARSYDGDSGGQSGPYVTVHTTFHDGAAYKCRTRGTMIRRSELRQVAAVLIAEADRLDALDERWREP